MGLYLNKHIANTKNNIEKLLTIVFSASTDTSINELVVKIKFAFKMLIFMSDDTIHVEVTFTLETATFETIWVKLHLYKQALDGNDTAAWTQVCEQFLIIIFQIGNMHVEI